MPLGSARRCLEAQPARRELVAVGRLHIPAPEMLPKPEPGREVEDDVGIGPRRPGRRHDRLAELHQGLGLGTDLEPEAQRLALEAGGDRQHDVGEFRGRVHEQVGVHVEVQRRECLPPAHRVGEASSRLEPKPTSPRTG